jgi:hypothetical protein
MNTICLVRDLTFKATTILIQIIPEVAPEAFASVISTPMPGNIEKLNFFNVAESTLADSLDYLVLVVAVKAIHSPTHTSFCDTIKFRPGKATRHGPSTAALQAHNLAESSAE